MDYRSSIARQSAAAELWMELTGRSREAAVLEAHDKLAAVSLEKLASGDMVDSKKKDAPRLGAPTGVGAALGATAGAGAGVAAAKKVNDSIPVRRPTKLPVLARTHGRVSLGKAGLGAGVAGAGLGAAAGLSVGIHRLRKHFKEKAASSLSTTQKRLIGAGLGAAGAGAVGGAYHYSQAKPGKSGKSKHEMQQQAELDKLKGLFAHQGRDIQSLKGTKGLKKRYREMLVDHTQQAKKKPMAAAAVGALPYAAGGALVGGALASKVLR